MHREHPLHFGPSNRFNIQHYQIGQKIINAWVAEKSTLCEFRYTLIIKKMFLFGVYKELA